MDCCRGPPPHYCHISQTDALLPFESALLAILLEQAKEIIFLRQKLEALDDSHRLMS